MIPKAPSHYCRKESSKIYLSSVVTTLSKLHHIYKARCAVFNKKHFSEKKFSEYFHNNNYSLFKLKKDVYNTCMAYEEGNVSDVDFVSHQNLKNAAFALKETDKKEADNITKMCVTADTEALLLAPLSDASIMFFHSKLNLHNFTFFDLYTINVENYLW